MIRQIKKTGLVVCVLLFSVSCDSDAKVLQENVKESNEELDLHEDVFVVAQDNSGDYTTLREAFQALPNDSKTWTTIQVKRGIYEEKLVLDVHKNKVKIVGEDAESTVITWNDHTGKVVDGLTIGTYTSYTLSVQSDDVIFSNITIANDAGPSAGQAVACETRGDKIAFFNCRLVGDQDTFFTRGDVARVYVKNSYIEGTTDYIFGPSIAVFDSCHIYSKKNSYVTAASTTEKNEYGYVFLDCKITATPQVSKLYLGRPWRSFAKTVYIRCELPAVIIPEGWHNWSNPENEKTAYYAEYQSTGPGAAPSKRVSWSWQLTDEEVAKYTLDRIFGKDTGKKSFPENWIPSL
ncbi:Pectinesterase A [termite gut metagenome]|uniref:Pectinesterase A n=1 Tax=termite gut metagenome TaxID=433724 RepID=A0A5J4SZN9_9ZZZZ